MSREAIEFLKQIVPYLHTYKKGRSKLILKYSAKLTVRNGKYSKELMKKKIQFVKRLFILNPTKRNRVLSFT